jgi:hypothetical protein
MFRNTSQTSQAAMNMLFNAERPRFDSHLRSARLLPQRATGASAPLATATQQPVSWVPSFRFRWLPRCACAATGRERLDSRFLSSRAVRAAGRQGSRAAGLSQSSRTLSPESRPRDPASIRSGSSVDPVDGHETKTLDIAAPGCLLLASSLRRTCSLTSGQRPSLIRASSTSQASFDSPV